MEQKQVIGIVEVVAGAGICLWAVARFVSFAGQCCTWQPPFSNYELATLGGAAAGLLLIAAGIVRLVTKQDRKSGGDSQAHEESRT